LLGGGPRLQAGVIIYDDEIAKSLKTVTPAEAGVQNSLNLLDSRFRGNDKNGEVGTFYEILINVFLLIPVRSLCLRVR
jgi:hypothetical protein